MKSKIERIITVFIIVVFLTEAFIPIVGNAYSDSCFEDAENTIAFYNQTRGATEYSKEKKGVGWWTDGYWDKQLKAKYGVEIYHGTNTWRYISNRACNMLAYANALQWLTASKANNDRQIDILYELYKVDSNPASGNAQTAYGNYIISRYGAQYGIATASKSKSWNNIVSVINNGGCFILHVKYGGGGHYSLVVGYQIAKINGVDTKLLQVVDSSTSSTIKRIPTHTAYSFTNLGKKITGNFNSNTSNYGQYWIRYDDFNSTSKDTFSFAFTSKAKAKKYEPKKIELDTTETVIYLNETLPLAASVYPAEANQSISWTSSDPSIATVDSNGNVHPLKTGTVTIKAASSTVSSVYAECSVRIDYQGTGSINYNNIKFPYHLKVNSSGVSGGYTFAANSGTISAAEGSTISSVVFKIYRSNGATLEYVKNNVDAQAITMESVSSNLNALFKQISGKNTSCYFEITVTDNHGRVLSAGRNFDTRTDGVNTSTANSQGVQPFTWNYTDPILIDTTFVNGKRYELWKSSRTWTEAASFANDMGGYLASISSAEENTLAHNMLKNFQASAANTGGTWVGAWIGGSKQNNEWSWTDGSAFSYTNWNSGNPSNDWGTEHYTGLRYTDGKWNSVNDNNAYYCTFIIEYDEVKVTDILLEGEPIVTVDDQFTLIPTVLPENASNKTIYFATSDSDVATVDVITGEVTALSEGEVTIAAIAQDGSDVVGTFSLYVQYKPIHPTGITLKADNNLYTGMNTITVYAGEEFYLDTIFTPADTDDQSVYYYSDDEGIAIVEDYTSKVIALSPGTCELVAVSNDGGIESRLTLIVLNASVILPENLTEIEDEAFIGTAISYVRLPEGITRIGSRAFADCPNLHRIYIPESCTSIAADVFTPGIDLTIYGQDGSYAEFYAGNHGFDFVAMGN